jgi:aspartate aminotransferase-like enzyme
MINHRGPEFAMLLARCTEGIQRALATRNDVVFVTASGTGGLEAAVVNHLSPDDPVLAVSIGSFGERFAKIAATYGADVRRITVEPGQAADPVAVASAIADMRSGGRPPRAVLLTHNETSTGVTNPIAELAHAVRSEAPDALLLVDGISGVGAIPFETDAWGLDVVVTGSQKSWMVPPGVAMLAVSERAWAAAESATMPRFYFDLRAHRDYATRGQTPWTPAIGIFYALGVGLDLIEAEGYPAVFARHAACGAATRAGLEALGFRLFADRRYASDTVTAVWLPDGVEWKAFDADLRARGLVAAGGQGNLAGKIFRIGHLGDVTLADILAVMEILEESFEAMGRPIERGSAVAAASRAADEVMLGMPAGAAAR